MQDVRSQGLSKDAVTSLSPVHLCQRLSEDTEMFPSLCSRPGVSSQPDMPQILQIRVTQEVFAHWSLRQHLNKNITKTNKDKSLKFKEKKS